MAGSNRKTLTSSDDQTEKVMAAAEEVLRKKAAEETDRFIQSLGLSTSDYTEEQKAIDAKTKAAAERLAAADRAAAEEAKAEAEAEAARVKHAAEEKAKRDAESRIEPIVPKSPDTVVVPRRSSQSEPLVDETASLIAEYKCAVNNFEAFLNFIHNTYRAKNNLILDRRFATFNGGMDGMIEKLKAKKSEEENQAAEIASESLLESVFDHDNLNPDQTTSKQRVFNSTKDFLSSANREFNKTNEELALAQQQSQQNKSRKANETIAACKAKIKTLTDNVITTGMYVEKVMYNQATTKDYKMMNEYIEKQENPVLKNVLRGLFGVTLITAGVFTIIGGATLALALGKTIALSPLSIHVAHTSFTLGLTTIKAGAGILAGLTGAGVVYGGSRLFASAIRPSTSKDYMALIQEAREGMPLVQVDEDGNHLPRGTHKVINRGEDGRKGSELGNLRKASK